MISVPKSPRWWNVVLARRRLLRAPALIGGPIVVALGLGMSDDRFAPEDWLRRRRIGKLSVTTPQSGKPVRPFESRSLEAWREERSLYERAYVELVGPWPSRCPALEPRVLEEHRSAKWTRYKVSFATVSSPEAHASTIRAWLFIPATRSGRLPAIVTLHQTVSQGKDEPAGIKPTVPWLAFATYYAERGYVTLAPDMIGFGERTVGGYERTGCEWPDARPILDAHPEMTLLGLMLFDVSRCVDYLLARPEVAPDRIGVIGHSLGGILVNGVLPLEDRFRVGVASCGYGLFRGDNQFPARWAAYNSAYLPRLALYRDHPDELPLDFHQILALTAPRPHLIQTAMGDTIWTRPAVAQDPFVIAELRRIRGLYGRQAVDDLVAIEPLGGATDRDHGWYPETQRAADALFDRVLKRGDR
jgi:dienelactone hydrolase